MQFFLIFLILWIAFVLLKYLFAIICLLARRNKVIKLFCEIDTLYKKRYAVMESIFDNNIPDELLQLKTLSDEKFNIDRKLALNYILESEIEENKISNAEYDELTKQIIKIGKEYNTNAQRLKISTEIYPASLLARLMNIKSVGFVKAAYK